MKFKKIAVSFCASAALCFIFTAPAVSQELPALDGPAHLLVFPLVNGALAEAGMNSLNKRLGDLRRTNERDDYGIWMRGHYRASEIGDGFFKIDTDIYGGEAGIDFRVFKNSEDRFYVGFMGGYLQTEDLKVKIPLGGPDYLIAKGAVKAPAAGIYGAWLGESGWFADIAARYFFTRTDLTTYDSGGSLVWDKNEMSVNIPAISAEFGKEFRSEISPSSAFLIEPKVKAAYIYTPSKTAEMSPGYNLEYKQSNSLTGRAGVLLAYSKTYENNINLEPYIDGGFSYEFDGKYKMADNHGAFSYAVDLSGGYFDIGGGVNARLTDYLSIYTYGGYAKGANERKNLMANAGIRFTFGDSKPAPAGFAPPLKAETPPPAPKTKTLADIDETRFDFGEAVIKPEYDDYYKKVAKEIIEYGGKVSIEGHTDNIGTAEYNKKLSRQRAQAVYIKLHSLGVPGSQMTYKGHGFDRPVNPADTAEARAQNRRVEILIIK